MKVNFKILIVVLKCIIECNFLFIEVGGMLNLSDRELLRNSFFLV